MYDDQGQALKVAKGSKGLAQNRGEAKYSGKSPYLNPVTEHAPDYSWLKQKLTTPYDPAQLGVEDPDLLLKQIAEGRVEGELSPAAQKLQERMQQIFKDVPEIDPRDVGKVSQWGVDKYGEPVLIDYGFLKGAPVGVAGALGVDYANRQK